MPIAQMLFDSKLPAYLLGSDMHANGDYGPGLENLMRCTETNDFSYARRKCGHVSKVLLTCILKPLPLSDNSNKTL
jgi:hypothetical protein